jgi:hypothetical protein
MTAHEIKVLGWTALFGFLALVTVFLFVVSV